MKVFRSSTPIRFFPVLLFVLLALHPLPASGRQDVYYPDTDNIYWQQEVDCEIHVTLDTGDQTLSGTEKIIYTNNSPDTLKQFFFHLYPNAYREKDSQLFRDYMPGTKYFLLGLTKSRRGWIDVTKLAVDGKKTEFSVEGTILSADFPFPLPPGGKAAFEIEFTEKIRKRLGRAGYINNHYDIAQWYPKIVVYDKNGWHPDQFRKGEFYGEFGNFDVSITLPDKYVIAATGVPVSGDPGWEKNSYGENAAGTFSPPNENPEKGSSSESGNPAASADGRAADSPAGLKTVRFSAQMVHDFAWCADPDFVVQDTTWNDIHIMSFYRKSSRAWKDSVLARGVRTMKWLEEFAGPYGYPQVSIVDCPIHGGMEYPMLAMNGGPGETIILHEVGHNYFYAMLANNERDEGWMDEGFTQYQMFRYAHDNHGPLGHPGKHGGHSSRSMGNLWGGISKPVINAHRTGFAERVATPHHEFKNSSRTMLYLKAPLFLRYLHYVVGAETFDEIIHTYVEKWKFKHVDEKAFLSVCEDVSGMDLEELFRQWLHTTKNCDFSLENFEVERTGEGYKADVRIERLGELITPISLVFRFADGNSISKRIDGMPRTIKKSYTFDKKPLSAAINPGNEILDIYQINNYQPRKTDIAFDNPLSGHYPSDAYQFRWLPIGFYNDIDGAKLGLRLKGSYDNMYRKFTLQSLYSSESGSYDVYGDFQQPLGYLGRDASIILKGYYREGRQGASMALNKTLRKSYSDPSVKHLSLRFAYQELTDDSYVFPDTYEKGANIRSGLSLSTSPKTDLFSTNIEFGFDRSFWGSKNNYEKSSLEARLWPSRRFPFPLKPRVRFFVGHTSIDPPIQEKYRLSGAGALFRENYFPLRSKGAFWKNDYDNIRVSGGANLRGYFDCGLNFKRVIASNMELQLPFPLPLPGKLAMMSRRQLYIFYDWGKVYDSNPFLELSSAEISRLENRGVTSEIFKDGISDFGIGISLFGITADFPIYLSRPSVVNGKEKWDFRWTIGISKLF